MANSWDEHYRSGFTPWDTRVPSRELRRLLDSGVIHFGSKHPAAVELGCGTGTNAIDLARRGFRVTAFDLSEVALASARKKATEAGVQIDFRQADVCQLTDDPQSVDLPRFDFVFDRGCFHCTRRENLAGSLRTLDRLTHAGSTMLVLTGNANDPCELGPPKVTEAELRRELGDLFVVHSLREFHFEDPGGAQGPLGWSCFLRRR